MTISQETKVDLSWLAWAIPLGVLIGLLGTALCLYAVACRGLVLASQGAFELEDEDE